MATFKQNNIQFTADNATLSSAGKKMTKFGNIDNGDFSDCGDEPGKYPVFPFINAVEIDWNKAEIGPNSYINTTGELISYIAQKTLITKGGQSEGEIGIDSTTKFTYLNFATQTNGGLLLKDDYNSFSTTCDNFNTLSKSYYSVTLSNGDIFKIGFTENKEIKIDYTPKSVVQKEYKYNVQNTTIIGTVSPTNFPSIIDAQNAAILHIENESSASPGKWLINVYNADDVAPTPSPITQTIYYKIYIGPTVSPENYAYFIYEGSKDLNLTYVLTNSYIYTSEFKYNGIGEAENLGDIYVKSYQGTNKIYTRVAASSKMTYVYEGNIAEYDYRNKIYTYSIEDYIIVASTTPVPTTPSNNQTYSSQLYGGGEQTGYETPEDTKTAAIKEIESNTKYTDGVSYKIICYENGKRYTDWVYQKTLTIVCTIKHDKTTTISEGTTVSLLSITQSETFEPNAKIKLSLSNNNAQFISPTYGAQVTVNVNSINTVKFQAKETDEILMFTLSGEIDKDTVTKKYKVTPIKFTINPSPMSFVPGSKTITNTETTTTFNSAQNAIGTVEYEITNPSVISGLQISSGTTLTWNSGAITPNTTYTININAKDKIGSEVYKTVPGVFNLSVIQPVIYKYYLGSSDNCVNDGNNPTMITPANAQYQESSTRPLWDNSLGDTIKTDTLTDNYTWVVLPTVWFNKLVIKTPLPSVVTFDPDRVWTCVYNNVNYTMAWGDFTAKGLYFTFQN